jgi:hypothetical protein
VPYGEADTRAKLVDRALGVVENMEMLFLSTRLLRVDLFEVPADGDLRLVPTT